MTDFHKDPTVLLTELLLEVDSTDQLKLLFLLSLAAKVVVLKLQNTCFGKKLLQFELEISSFMLI